MYIHTVIDNNKKKKLDCFLKCRIFNVACSISFDLALETHSSFQLGFLSELQLFLAPVPIGALALKSLSIARYYNY